MRRRIAVHLLLCLSLPATATGELPAPLPRLLAESGIPPEGISLEVHRIGDAAPLATLNAERPRNPASVIKLVTTLAGLELLGAAYTWRTDYHLDGALRDGRLAGDLVMRGGGDPWLVTERFWRQLHALRDRGLREISGDLVLDDSAFTPAEQRRDGFDSQGDRVYNVLPSATLVNFSATRFVFVPRNGKLTLFADPPADNLRIDNRITLAGGKCGGSRRGWAWQALHGDGGTVAQFTGRYTAACGESALTRAVLSNEDYTWGVFSAMWRELGGTIGGGLRKGRAPAGKPFLRSESRPLREVITGINKFSNNVMARLLLLAIGRETRGEPGSAEAGIRAIREWLASRGVAMPALVMENGAGLSRRSRASARGLGNLLRAGWTSGYRPEFLASLPLAAADGTMRKRLEGADVGGRVRIKTGLLKNTRAMAGYVKGDSGDDYTVVLLLEGTKAGYENGNRLQDALLRWLLER